MHFMVTKCISKFSLPIIILHKIYLSPTFLCSVVLTEGDPHPSALKGRMSFQNFNPSVEVSTFIDMSFKAFFIIPSFNLDHVFSSFDSVLNL